MYFIIVSYYLNSNFSVWGFAANLELRQKRLDQGVRQGRSVLEGEEGKGGSNWGYAWIPIAGPLLGGALAAFAWLALQ